MSQITDKEAQMRKTPQQWVTFIAKTDFDELFASKMLLSYGQNKARFKTHKG